MKDFDNTTVPISTADTCMKKNAPAGIRGKSSSSTSSNIYSAPIRYKHVVRTYTVGHKKEPT